MRSFNGELLSFYQTTRHRCVEGCVHLLMDERPVLVTAQGVNINVVLLSSPICAAIQSAGVVLQKDNTPSSNPLTKTSDDHFE